jgi:tetratricopeptide (TPR) repeat protein
MTPDRIESLIQRCWDAPFGAGQIALAEEAIAQADALGEESLRFDARMAATNAYQHGGEPAKGFVTFSWCLAQYDRDPETYGHQEHLLLWYFKYMVNSLTRFPEVPLARTYAVLDDMQRRYQQGGHSLQAVHKHRWLVAMHVGDRAAAEAHYESWQAAPRDSNSDCRGCDPTDQVWHLAQRDRDEEAIALTEPVLAGRLTCAEQPQAILTQLLIPYLRTGRFDQARSAHHTAYRAIRTSPANLTELADHLHFLAVSGNEVYGLELVQRHLSWLDRAPTPFAEMWFAASAALVLRRIVETSGDRELTTGQTAGALGAELAARATALALRFDARNGTSHQSAEIDACLNAQQLVERLALSLVPPSVPPLPGTQKKKVATLDDVPNDADLDLLLDLSEDALWRDDSPRVEALWVRVSGWREVAGLTTLQQARLADLHGMRLHDGDTDELVRVWNEARDFYHLAGDTVREQRTRGRLGLHMCRHGDAEVGLAEVRQTTNFLLANASPKDKAAAIRRLGVALLHAGQASEAVSTLDKLEEVSEPDPGPRVKLQVLMIKAQALGAAGLPAEALVAAEELVEGAAAVEESELIGLGEFIAGQSHLLLENANEAVQSYERALAQEGLPVELVREIRERRGMLLAGTSRAAEAVDDLASFVARLVGEGQQGEADYARFQLAVALFNADRPSDAAEVAEEALYGADNSENQGLADQVRHLLSAIYQRLDEPQQALSHLDQLAQNLNGYDNVEGRARVLEQAGDLLFDLDKDAAAAERFATAAAAYEAAGLPFDRLRVLRRQAVASMFGLGPREAIEVLAEADMVASNAAADVDVTGPDVQYELAWLALDGARVLAGSGEAEAALERVRLVPGRFRELESFGEAFLAELTMGEVLLTLGRAAEAEPVLLAVVGGLPRDAGALPRAAYALAHALLQLDRPDEARRLAEQFGFELD